MVIKVVLMLTLVTIWIGLLTSLINLFGATKFWLKHANERAHVTPLPTYPTVTIVVPAHNEELVIAQTTQAILNPPLRWKSCCMLITAVIRRLR